MRRVLEPEYMDTSEEAADYQSMDHSAANAAVVQRFLELGGGRCARVVDLGTGPGDIPVLLAARSEIPTIVGVDAAEQMLALARPKAAPFGGRLRFEQADAKALPYPDRSFDGVFSNTILHHIPEPVAFLREAWRVFRPGGVLLIRDLFRPESEAAAWRLVDLHAAGADDRQRLLFFQSFCAALTLDEAREAVCAAGMQNARVELSSDRHYTIEIAG